MKDTVEAEGTEIQERAMGALPDASHSHDFLTVIERIAYSPDLPVERLEKMLDMQERIIATQSKAEHADAKASAMGEMPDVPKSGRGHNNIRYSTLHDITSTTRPVLAKYGLSLSFDVKVDDSTICVTAKLTHRNGYEETTSLPLPFDKSGNKNAVQAIGSSQTYGQRYTAQALLGLSMDDASDDDGKAAGGPPTISAEQAQKIADLLLEHGVDEERFLAFGKIDRIGDVRADQFEAACTHIKQAGANA